MIKILEKNNERYLKVKIDDFYYIFIFCVFIFIPSTFLSVKVSVYLVKNFSYLSLIAYLISMLLLFNPIINFYGKLVDKLKSDGIKIPFLNFKRKSKEKLEISSISNKGLELDSMLLTFNKKVLSSQSEVGIEKDKEFFNFRYFKNKI